jgi:hypothetical protein
MLENLAKLARLITMGQPLRGQAVGEAIDLCVIEWRNDKARIEGLEKLYLRHIHGHRLGTDETADECPSCRQLMENQIIALRSEEE